MTPAVGLHLIYLTVSLTVTLRAGRSLHHHGRPFLVDVFAGRVWLADATNHALLVGFTLTNSALVLLFVALREPPATWDAAIASLSFQLGVVLVTLGVMHFGNLAILLAVRQLLRYSPLAMRS